MKELEQAEANKDWAAIEKAYHKLSAQLKTRTAILYRFTGKASRDLLLEQYKNPANQKRDALTVPVTVYMNANKAAALYAEGKKEEAMAIVNATLPLVDKLPSESTVPAIKELKVYLEKLYATISNKCRFLSIINACQ